MLILIFSQDVPRCSQLVSGTCYSAQQLQRLVSDIRHFFNFMIEISSISGFFTDACSHGRSVALMIESIIMNPSKTAFSAMKCTSVQLLSLGNWCLQFSNTTVNFLGLYATKTPSGNFFLKTNAASPYSMS